MTRRNEVEDGMGFAGLVPSADELRDERELKRLSAEIERLKDQLSDADWSDIEKLRGDLTDLRAENEQLRTFLREIILEDSGMQFMLGDVLWSRAKALAAKDPKP